MSKVGKPMSRVLLLIVFCSLAVLGEGCSRQTIPTPPVIIPKAISRLPPYARQRRQNYIQAHRQMAEMHALQMKQEQNKH
jgi:hypothetical protein